MKDFVIGRGDKKRIAEAAGVTPNVVTRYLKGEIKTSIIGIYIDAYIAAQKEHAAKRVEALLKKEEWKKARSKKAKTKHLNN